MKLKKILIIVVILLILGFGVLGFFVVSTIMSPKVKYNRKYYFEDSYITFKSDGTCLREYDDVDCSYTIFNKNITVNEVGKSLSSDNDKIIKFHIKDKYTLEHYETIIDDIKQEETDDFKYGSIWKIDDEKTTETTTEKYIETRHLKKYNLLDNGKAKIKFLENNECVLYLSNLEETSEKAKVTYIDGRCDYKLTGNKMEVTTTYKYNIDKLNYSNSWGVVSTNLLTEKFMNHAVLEFNDDFSEFEFINGKMVQSDDILGIKVYVYVEEKEENVPVTTPSITSTTKSVKTTTTKKSTTAKTTSKTTASTTSVKETTTKATMATTVKTTTSTTITTTTTKSKEQELKEKADSLFSKATTELKHIDAATLDYFILYFNNPDKYKEIQYTVIIDGNSYDATNDTKVERFSYTQAGDNCVDYTIKDNYGNSRDEHKCIKYTSVSPYYRIARGYQTVSGCWFNLWDGESYAKSSTGYNRLGYLTCKLDGKDTTCSTAYQVMDGSHTLILTNKYGASQTIDFECIN